MQGFMGWEQTGRGSRVALEAIYVLLRGLWGYISVDLGSLSAALQVTYPTKGHTKTQNPRWLLSGLPWADKVSRILVAL